MPDADVRSEYLPWAWRATGLVAFSVLLMLGRHMPVFSVLYKICPMFRIPYATRWYTLCTMGLALLVGIGVTLLLEPRPEESPANRRRVIGCLVFITLVALAAIFLPFGYWKELSDVKWFLRVPVLYWLVCTVLLGLLCVRWNPRRAGKLIVLFTLAGLLQSAWLETYRPTVVTWGPEQAPTRGPAVNELYRFMRYASRFDKDPMVRTGYSRVFADNTALLYGGNSFLGLRLSR